MRIVAGVYGGRKLNVPKGRDVRPTSDKIRGAMFNMLSSRDAVVDARVLDAFCGTGALGLEALSRGASHAIFLDKSRTSLDLARENAQILGVENASFRVCDSSKFSEKRNDEDTYSLIFLDPPYHKGLILKSLERLHHGDWLSDDAWVMCESERSFCLLPSDFFSFDVEKIYGDIKITLLRYHRSF